MDFSWPLPQTITVSPLLANLRMAKLMASCLSGMRKKYFIFSNSVRLWVLSISFMPPFWQPLAIWAIISLTSSVLGSSAVRTAKPASLAAISPMIGLFTLSLKPAVPKTTISLFFVWLLAKVRASFNALILWAKSMTTFIPCLFLILSILPGPPGKFFKAFPMVSFLTLRFWAAAAAISMLYFWKRGVFGGSLIDSDV